MKGTQLAEAGKNVPAIQTQCLVTELSPPSRAPKWKRKERKTERQTERKKQRERKEGQSPLIREVLCLPRWFQYVPLYLE